MLAFYDGLVTISCMELLVEFVILVGLNVLLFVYFHRKIMMQLIVQHQQPLCPKNLPRQPRMKDSRQADRGKTSMKVLTGLLKIIEEGCSRRRGTSV